MKCYFCNNEAIEKMGILESSNPDDVIYPYVCEKCKINIEESCN